MKKIMSLIFFVFSLVNYAQTPCDNGMAGPYPCNGYDLQSFIPFETFNASSGNDSWGWTDPQDGKEYALMGLNNGMFLLIFQILLTLFILENYQHILLQQLGEMLRFITTMLLL